LGQCQEGISGARQWIDGEWLRVIRLWAVIPKIESGVVVIPPEDLKYFGEMGEAQVRLQFGALGFSYPRQNYARVWLAELDEVARKRTEALRAEQTELAKSTSRAAWYAVYAALGAIGATVLCTVLGTAYTIYAQNQIEAHHAMIRGAIARYIERGNAIENDFGNTQISVDETDAKRDEWVSDVERFFRDNSMESYISRFHDNSGIQAMAPIGMIDYNDPHFVGFAHLHPELVRLEEFSHEFP
jgi:hypothetical protein